MLDVHQIGNNRKKANMEERRQRAKGRKDSERENGMGEKKRRVNDIGYNVYKTVSMSIMCERSMKTRNKRSDLPKNNNNNKKERKENGMCN